MGRGDFDEEGEPIFDPDMPSDREPSPEPGEEDNYASEHEEEKEEKEGEEEGEEEVAEFSKELHDASDNLKPRKRLIKKTSRENPSSSSLPGSSGNDEEESGDKDEGEEEENGRFMNNYDEDEDLSKKMRREKLLSLKAKGKLQSTSSGKVSKVVKNNKKRERPVSPPKLSHRGDREVKEMWDTVAGNESEVALVRL